MTTKAKTSLAALAVLATLGLGASGAAQAHGGDVYWSIGMSSPGVVVDVSNAPVVMQPPVVYAPAPVVVAPRPVYYPQPVYRVVYPGYYQGGYGGYGRWQGRRDWDDDRWEGRREYREHDRGEHRGWGEGERRGEYRPAPPLGRR
jgi:hypothetical protein